MGHTFGKVLIGCTVVAAGAEGASLAIATGGSAATTGGHASPAGVTAARASDTSSETSASLSVPPAVGTPAAAPVRAVTGGYPTAGYADVDGDLPAHGLAHPDGESAVHHAFIDRLLTADAGRSIPWAGLRRARGLTAPLRTLPFGVPVAPHFKFTRTGTF